MLSFTARSISASSSQVKIPVTGPKISSCAMRISFRTFSNKVGCTNKPDSSPATVEICSYVGKIEMDSVSLRRFINPVNVADTLRLNQGTYRPPPPHSAYDAACQRIAALIELAASPPSNASRATTAVFRCPITASFSVS